MDKTIIHATCERAKKKSGKWFEAGTLVRKAMEEQQAFGISSAEIRPL